MQTSLTIVNKASFLSVRDGL